MQLYRPAAALAAFAIMISGVAAGEFRLAEVGSLAALDLRGLRPQVVSFAEGRDDGQGGRSGLIPFDEWARTMPVQKQFLAPYPSYAEPTVSVTSNGVTRSATEKLSMYVAQARFALPKPPQSIDLSRYATIAFLERIDPAIKEQPILASDLDGKLARNPDRPWCETKPATICIQSRYEFEGRLPTAIRLVNQLVESKKKRAEYLEFQSELRTLGPSELDHSAVSKLTGVDSPIASALEQTIFHVNQVMEFGKFLAVLQQDPADPNRTIVTAFIALAIKARVLENNKKYENVPVLRNLVPGQVLMGRSSFNTGTSLSAGLPLYARNRIKAIAGFLDSG